MFCNTFRKIYLHIPFFVRIFVGAMNIPDTYKYNSVDVANFLIAYANEHRVYINMTKMQKLLYICYGVHLAVKSERLTNEHPQAWPYGPVLPTTRNKLLKSDFDAITMDSVPQELKGDAEFCALVEFVFSVYGKFTAGELTEWSHKNGSAWHHTTMLSDFNWGREIPDSFIYDYFDKNLVRG